MFCGMVMVCSAFAEINPKPFVVPELTNWVGAEGKFMPSGRVILSGSSKDLLKTADIFVADYEALTGKKLIVGKGKAQKGDFVLTLKKIRNWDKRAIS